MRWIVLGLVMTSLGCEESVESTDVRTTGIYPVISVTADGSGNSRVEVRLKVGGSNSNTHLDLKGGDELQATVGNETKTLDETSDETYTATFGVDEEGTEFTIAFLRDEEDESAPASTVALPAPFEMSVSAREASRADDDVEITWEPPASGELDWGIDGDCIKTDDGELPDDGMHTLEAGSIETFDSDKEESCTVEVSLARARRGNIDPAFTEGGRIEALQVRSDTFTSTP
jgi:hypothetical protein